MKRYILILFILMTASRVFGADFISKDYIDSVNRFAFNYLLANREKNTVFMPSQIMTGVSLLGAGASEREKESIITAFLCKNINFDTFIENNVKSYKYLDKPVLKSQGLLYLTDIWIEKDLELSQEYKMFLNSFFNKTPQTADFSDPAIAAETISKFYNDNRLPKNIATPDFIGDSYSVISAVSLFTPVWQQNFLPANSYVDQFHGYEYQRAIKYMQTKAEFLYQSTDYYQYIQIPLENNFYLSIFLPNDKPSLKKLLENLAIDEIKPHGEMTPIALSLPIISISGTSEFMRFLAAQGMKELGYNSLFARKRPISIGDIFSYSKINLIETKKEKPITPKDMQYTELKINKPFVFVIQESKLNLNIFSGLFYVSRN